MARVLLQRAHKRQSPIDQRQTFVSGLVHVDINRLKVSPSSAWNCSETAREGCWIQSERSAQEPWRSGDVRLSWRFELEV